MQYVLVFVMFSSTQIIKSARPFIFRKKGIHIFLRYRSDRCIFQVGLFVFEIPKNTLIIIRMIGTVKMQEQAPGFIVLKMKWAMVASFIACALGKLAPPCPPIISIIFL
jgi:hypothetical protein